GAAKPPERAAVEPVRVEGARLAVPGLERADPVVPADRAQGGIVLRDVHEDPGEVRPIPDGHVVDRRQEGDRERTGIRQNSRGPAPDLRICEVVAVVLADVLQGNRPPVERRAQLRLGIGSERGPWVRGRQDGERAQHHQTDGQPTREMHRRNSSSLAPALSTLQNAMTRLGIAVSGKTLGWAQGFAGLRAPGLRYKVQRAALTALAIGALIASLSATSVAMTGVADTGVTFDETNTNDIVDANSTPSA